VSYPPYPPQQPQPPQQPYGGVPTQPVPPGYPPTQPVPPGYGYPPPPPYYPPPVPPTQKSSKVGWIILAVVLGVVLLCGGGVIGVVFWANKAVHDATTPTSGRLNQPARDGQLEFTVTGTSCGKATEGNGSQTVTAQGQFCEISLTVRNIGTDARVFTGAFQEAKGAGGATYRDDFAAEFASSADSVFFDQINPGNQVQGVLVFDLPKDDRIVSLELHDSPLSAGVLVAVG
jgi:Domain of unknown function (DUF4352)